MASKSLVKKLDAVFSKYIRQRDSKNGVFKCCSCGQIKVISQADAGHFINRKWMPTRWDESNVHAQCMACNRFDEGNHAGYALFMANKYGVKHIEYLLANSHTTSDYSDFEVTMMIKHYSTIVNNNS